MNPRKEQISPSASNTNQTARIFITGSADGLGHAAATTLLTEGYQVVVHVRSQARLAAVQDLLDRGAVATIGDLSDFTQARDLASQVNKVGQMDAVIHNAGVYSGPQVLPVNVVAPYLLTAFIRRPEPFPTTTFSLDIPSGGVLKAGTLLTRAGAKAITAATTHGVLAYDVDATTATSGTVYLTGSFLRDLIVAANSGATIDDAFEDGLRAKGIYLERSIGT